MLPRGGHNFFYVPPLLKCSPKPLGLVEILILRLCMTSVILSGYICYIKRAGRVVAKLGSLTGQYRTAYSVRVVPAWIMQRLDWGDVRIKFN